MKAIVDRDLCIGCSLCAEICPAVFIMGDDNIAVALTGDLPAGEEAAARDATDSCPVTAITLAD